MPPASRAPRTAADRMLLALIVAAVLAWLASFCAVTIDPAGRAWKWLALAAVVLLFTAAIATLFTIVRRRST